MNDLFQNIQADLNRLNPGSMLQPPAPERSVSRADLQNELIEMAGISQPYISAAVDRLYYPVSYEWLAIAFAAYWPRFSSYFGLRFQAELFDCDNFARAARFAADLCMLRTPVSGAAHTVFECGCILRSSLNGITPKNGGGHATNLVRCTDGQWHFFEGITNEITPAKPALDRGDVRLTWVRL